MKTNQFLFLKIACLSIFLTACANKQTQQTIEETPPPELLSSDLNSDLNTETFQEENISTNDYETTTLIDPSVQAVIDSGEISETDPDIIQNLLDTNTFHFSFDSYKLDNQDIESLNAKAAYLKSDIGSNKNIVIQGHTDERGTRTYNLSLGTNRAKAIKNYLEAKGISGYRIEVISFGFEKPIDPRHTPEAWAKNRRALVIIN